MHRNTTPNIAIAAGAATTIASQTWWATQLNGTTNHLAIPVAVILGISAAGTLELARHAAKADQSKQRQWLLGIAAIQASLLFLISTLHTYTNVTRHAGYDEFQAASPNTWSAVAIAVTPDLIAIVGLIGRGLTFNGEPVAVNSAPAVTEPATVTTAVAQPAPAATEQEQGPAPEPAPLLTLASSQTALRTEAQTEAETSSSAKAGAWVILDELGKSADTTKLIEEWLGVSGGTARKYASQWAKDSGNENREAI